MSYRNDSPFRCATGPFRWWWNRRRSLFVAALTTAIGCMFAFHIWMGLLMLGLFLAGTMLWIWRRRRIDATGAALKIRTSERPVAVQLEGIAFNDNPARHARTMARIADHILDRHPRWREAKLIKAGMLWQFYGDRDGARCYCQDLLCQTQPDDPLHAQACDLYMRTYAPWSSGLAPPAFPTHPGVTGKEDEGMFPAVESAKVIPFRLRQPRSLSTH